MVYFPGRFGGFGRSADAPESALRQNQRFGGIGGIGGIGSLGGIGRSWTELLVLISGSAVRRNRRFGGIDARAGGRAGWRTDEERTDGRTDGGRTVDGRPDEKSGMYENMKI